MEVKVFIENYRKAFGPKAGLPVAFWFSDEPAAPEEKVNGCFFKAFDRVRAGQPVALGAESITCGGGRLYTGFGEMNERIPEFVSLKERYKQTPELFREYVEELGIQRAETKYINFSRIDNLEDFSAAEALIFFATPDVLSGLATWATFDTNDEGAVSAIFGSGCCTAVTLAATENRRGGRRTFLGGFDPSVRPWFGTNELSFTIPMSRFAEMYETMPVSCLFDTHAWDKVRERINE